MNKKLTKSFGPFTFLAFLFAFTSTSAIAAVPHEQALNFYGVCVIYKGKTASANGRHGCCLKGKCIICTGDGVRNCKMVDQIRKLSDSRKNMTPRTSAPRARAPRARPPRITLRSHCKRFPKEPRCPKTRKNTNFIRK